MFMTIKLDNWSFCSVGEDDYTPPEMLVPVLCGKVLNHPNHRDGKIVTTSRVIGKRNGLVVTKSGTEYELLEVDPKYERHFPNAKDRLFKELKNI